MLFRSPFSSHTKWISSVCFFPDGTHFATGSFDGTIRIWTLDEIANEINWELRDNGWVVGENGELMMWIPTDLRRYICGHRNISMLNRSFYIKLDFGTERNTSENRQSQFLRSHHLIRLYHLVLFVSIFLLAFYLLFGFYSFVTVTIRMYYLCCSVPEIDSILCKMYMYPVCVSLANIVRK